MKNIRRYKTSSNSFEINISPLIDMMFLLLIFFIVTTTFVEESGITIQKPKAATAESLAKQSILLGVTREGRVQYGGKDIHLNAVRGLVAKLIERENRPVILIADKSAPSGFLVDVIDECKLAGAGNVSIATEHE